MEDTLTFDWAPAVARGNCAHTMAFARVARRARIGVAIPFAPEVAYIRSMSIQTQYRVDSPKNIIYSLCTTSLAESLDMPAPPTPEASRMTLRPTRVSPLRQYKSEMFIRTSISLSCDQILVPCASGELPTSSDHFPSSSDSAHTTAKASRSPPVKFPVLLSFVCATEKVVESWNCSI